MIDHDGQPVFRTPPFDGRLWHAVLGMVLSVPVLGFACARPRPTSSLPRSVVVGPSFRVGMRDLPREDTLYFSRTENVIRLVGAVNETVAFQFILSAAQGQAVGVELAAEDLVGDRQTLPRDAVRMYRQWPIRVERYPNWYLRSQGLRKPREIYDVLVPIDAPRHGQPFVIPAGDHLPIWIEIRIPSDAQPGTYKTGVLVRDAAGNTARSPLEVVVRDIHLAPDDAIPVLTRVQLGPIIAAHTPLDPLNLRLALADAEASRILHRAFEILHGHGLSPYTDEVRPLFRQDLRGAVQLDWTDYDRFCGPLIDGSAYTDGRSAHAWPVPVDIEQPAPGQYGGIESTLYAAILRDCLARVRDHFEECGWLGRSFTYFDVVKRRNPRAGDLAQVRRLAMMTHLVDEHLPFASTLIPQPMTAFGWFEHYFEDLSASVDIWATPARYQHAPTLKRLQTLGKQTWLLPDRPPFSGSLAVEAPQVHARSLAWQAFLQGHDAVLIPQATDWPERVLERPIRDRSQRSNSWLLYPGTPFGLNEPVPSVRLKQLQLGIQDYQHLRLLDAHGRGETARLLAGSLIKAVGTDGYGDNYQDGLFDRRIDDAAAWELARNIMMIEVADAMAGIHAWEPAGDAIQAAWAKFLGATRRILVRPDSARLTEDQRRGRTGCLVTYDVSIRSELRVPLRGRLEFGPLLPGAHRVSDIVNVGPIPEMGLVRKQLVLEMPGLPPTDLDGHQIQKIVFDAATSGRVETGAVLSIVQARQAPAPITIDGDLSDWPPSEFNIAGDFRLINVHAAGPSSTGPTEPPDLAPGGPRRQRPRAESQTVAYFCQDAGLLYVGIHAAVPDEAREHPDDRAHRNFVAYEDLMPIGEDLVEILIDPTNAGTQSGDLYHIVLKSTGNPVFERGVDTHPPIGKRRPWPGDPPRCAVAATEYGWCAEIAIAIASFGPEAARNPIWGVNLARLEPVRGEYSDWARAPRYCYDPRTLGNLVWPE